ncbi:hypothetical protein ACHAXR_003186 [Thalassiosira sp. AJA248-18]
MTPWTNRRLLAVIAAATIPAQTTTCFAYPNSCLNNNHANTNIIKGDIIPSKAHIFSSPTATTANDKVSDAILTLQN